MPKIPNDRVNFLNKISGLFEECSGRDSKLELLTEEHWKFYSSHWINLIITINKKIFNLHEESPLDGLKVAFLTESINDESETALLSRLENLTENWEDILGSSYYELQSSLFNFVFTDTVKILEALDPFIEDSEAFSEVIVNYKKSARFADEN